MPGIPALSFLVLASMLHCAISSNGTISCTQYPPTSIEAYMKWPFRIDCDSLEDVWKDGGNATRNDSYKCEIWNGVTFREAGIFEMQSANESTTYSAVLTVNDSVCLRNDIHVHLQPFPEASCAAFQNLSYANNQVQMRQGVEGGSLILRCIAPVKGPAIIPKGANKEDFKTHWKYNCDSRVPNDAYIWDAGRNIEDEDGYPDMFERFSLEFYDRGDYTCDVTYKGRTINVVNYGVCIKWSQYSLVPTLTCVTKTEEVLGGSTTLSCTAQLTLGVILPGTLTIKWLKDGEVLCENEIYNQTEIGYLDKRHSCIAKGDNSSVICNGKSVREEDIQDERREVDMKLKIRDIKSHEFGAYQVVVSYKNNNATEQVNVIRDMTPFYQKLVSILTPVLGVLLAIILAAFAVIRFQIYFQLLYKRSRLWKHDKDDKKYVAYVSYYFDNEMQGENLNATAKIVDAIHKQMDVMKYNYYDEHRDVDFSVQVERITNLIENCHRMIIVITPEFLDDPWMRFHAELGFYGMLESRMGLVFILIPGAQKLLPEKAKKDKAWEKVLVALKTNRVINWTEKMTDDRLRRYIEYALPKLHRERPDPDRAVAVTAV